MKAWSIVFGVFLATALSIELFTRTLIFVVNTHGHIAGVFVILLALSGLLAILIKQTGKEIPYEE